LREAKVILTVSNALKEKILKLGFQQKDVTVLYDGVDHELFYQLEQHKTRKELGIREVHAQYSRDMDQIRKIGGPRDCRKELWLYAPLHGWHFYEVFPGGVMERDRQ
jgi:hypothetical protein